MRKRGFTIVEMLMVIAILGVLVTIITAASSSAIRQSRARRTEAMRVVLQAGLSAYYTKEGEWPGALKNLCDKGPQSTDAKRSKIAYLSDTEADVVFQELVKQADEGTPLLDVSGLFVCRVSSFRGYGEHQHTRGMDFRAAKLEGKKRKEPIKTNQLRFGYPRRIDGDFLPFIIKYNFSTDTATVMTQNEGSSGNDFAAEEGTAWKGLGQ